MRSHFGISFQAFQGITLVNLKLALRGAWLASSVEHVTLNPRVISCSPILGGKIT